MDNSNTRRVGVLVIENPQFLAYVEGVVYDPTHLRLSAAAMLPTNQLALIYFLESERGSHDTQRTSVATNISLSEALFFVSSLAKELGREFIQGIISKNREGKITWQQDAETVEGAKIVWHACHPEPTRTLSMPLTIQPPE